MAWGSGLGQADERLAEKAEPVYQEWVEALRDSVAVHADETRWRVGGQGAGLWVLTGPRGTVYTTHAVWASLLPTLRQPGRETLTYRISVRTARPGFLPCSLPRCGTPHNPQTLNKYTHPPALPRSLAGYKDRDQGQPKDDGGFYPNGSTFPRIFQTFPLLKG